MLNSVSHLLNARKVDPYAEPAKGFGVNRQSFDIAGETLVFEPYDSPDLTERTTILISEVLPHDFGMWIVRGTNTDTGKPVEIRVSTATIEARRAYRRSGKWKDTLGSTAGWFSPPPWPFGHGGW